MSAITLNASFIPSSAVRDVQTEDGAVLLDIQQGLCFSMTPIAVKIWKMLKLNLSVSEIVDSLAAEFATVSREQILADAIELLADLRVKGLLQTGEPTQAPILFDRFVRRIQTRRRTEKGINFRQRPPRFLVWKALLGLIAFDLLRLGTNFPKIHSLVRSWRVSQVSSTSSTVDLVCRAVNYACVWYPKRVLCLQRSAVTTCLFRSCGIQAQMVMGAQKFPFKAHAWTEVEGQAINERRDVQSVYMVWERC